MTVTRRRKLMETQVGHEKMRRALARLYLQRRFGSGAAAVPGWLEDPPPDEPACGIDFLEILLDEAIAERIARSKPAK